MNQDMAQALHSLLLRINASFVFVWVVWPLFSCVVTIYRPILYPKFTQFPWKLPSAWNKYMYTLW